MKRFFFIITVAALIVTTSAIDRVFAQTADTAPAPSEQQLQYIAQSCAVSQAAIKSVQRADLVTRLERVREYNTLLELMNNFNARAIQNDVDATELVRISASVRERINKFSADFTTYDASVKSVTTMRCNEQPLTFYELIGDVRAKRSQMQTNVAELNADIEQYAAAVNTVQALNPGAIAP